MRKICFFSGDITRNGGTERVAAMIAGEFCRQGNYEILFLSLTEQRKEPFFFLEPGIRRYALGDRWLSPGPAYLPLIPRLRKFMKKMELDLIVDIDIVLDVLSVPAAAGLKTKVISWEHANCGYELSQTYRRYILKWFTGKADANVTLTPGDARHYRELFPRKERIRAIFNPVAQPSVSGQEPRNKWLITVARLVPGKGFDLLIPVAAKVLREHPDWTWYICGEGPERQRIEEMIAGEKLQDKMILTGLVEDVGEYLSKASVFVLTSKAEGLPMCLLEARTFGLPCVSFDIATGPSDIIEDGVNGYLIRPFACDEMAEKINSLLSSPQLLCKMAENAGKNLDAFYLPRIMGQWNETAADLLGEKTV